MTDAELLHLATEIAFGAHKGQSDKQGEPYIFHVMRVALACEGRARIVALFHDLVEDTHWTLAALTWKKLPPDIGEAVDALTRRKEEGETYDAYIERLSRNPLAVSVKLADLADNLARVDSLPEEQARSLKKRYEEAYRTLYRIPPKRA